MAEQTSILKCGRSKSEGKGARENSERILIQAQKRFDREVNVGGKEGFHVPLSGCGKWPNYGGAKAQKEGWVILLKQGKGVRRDPREKSDKGDFFPLQ